MQVEPFQLLFVIMTLIFLGLAIAGGVLFGLARETGYIVEESQPPEWGPTVSAPFSPSDNEVAQVPDMCPACGADLSPYEVQWDENSGEAYCPDCKFPLKRRHT